MKIIKTITLIFSITLCNIAHAETREQFVLIFEKYNEANKTNNTDIVLTILVKELRSVLEECLADKICGTSALKSMRDNALNLITYCNFKEIKKDKVYKLNYSGTEVAGRGGSGYVIFIKENDIWKISTTSWQYE